MALYPTDPLATPQNGVKPTLSFIRPYATRTGKRTGLLWPPTTTG